MDKQMQALLRLQDLIDAFNHGEREFTGIGKATIQIEPLGTGKGFNYGVYIVTEDYLEGGQGATLEEALTEATINFQARLDRGGW